jgi:hypothetical protein
MDVPWLWGERVGGSILLIFKFLAQSDVVEGGGVGNMLVK